MLFRLLMVFGLLCGSLQTYSSEQYEDQELLDLIAQGMEIEERGSDLGIQFRLDRMLEAYDQEMSLQEGRQSLGEEEIQDRPGKRELFIPFEMNQGDLVKAAVVAGTAVILFQNDEQIKQFAQEHKTTVTENIAVFGEQWGSDLPIAMAAGGYVLGVVMKNDKVKSLSVLAIKAFAISGLVTRALKTSFRRKRPSDTDNSNEWFGDLGDHSFPSGHTTLAFALGTFIAETTKGKSKVLPILAYGASTIAGLSRIHDNAHWASDVLIGALIGHLVTKNILSKKEKKSGFVLSPYVSLEGQVFLNLSWTPNHNRRDGSCRDEDNLAMDCIAIPFRKAE